MLKHKSTYEIMTPSDVGWQESRNVLGKHSGRHAFKTRLDELGLALDEKHLEKAFERFKTLCDKKKDIYDEDIEAIIEDQMENGDALFRLKSLQVVAGTSGTPTATVTLIDSSGEEITDAATGDGPIDAMFAVIQRITRISARLESFTIRSVTAGQRCPRRGHRGTDALRPQSPRPGRLHGPSSRPPRRRTSSPSTASARSRGGMWTRRRPI